MSDTEANNNVLLNEQEEPKPKKGEESVGCTLSLNDQIKELIEKLEEGQKMWEEHILASNSKKET